MIGQVESGLSPTVYNELIDSTLQPTWEFRLFQHFPSWVNRTTDNSAISGVTLWDAARTSANRINVALYTGSQMRQYGYDDVSATWTTHGAVALGSTPILPTITLDVDIPGDRAYSYFLDATFPGIIRRRATTLAGVNSGTISWATAPSGSRAFATGKGGLIVLSLLSSQQRISFVTASATSTNPYLILPRTIISMTACPLPGAGSANKTLIAMIVPWTQDIKHTTLGNNTTASVYQNLKLVSMIYDADADVWSDLNVIQSLDNTGVWLSRNSAKMALSGSGDNECAILTCLGTDGTAEFYQNSLYMYKTADGLHWEQELIVPNDNSEYVAGAKVLSYPSSGTVFLANIERVDRSPVAFWSNPDCINDTVNTPHYNITDIVEGFSRGNGSSSTSNVTIQNQYVGTDVTGEASGNSLLTSLVNLILESRLGYYTPTGGLTTIRAGIDRVSRLSYRKGNDGKNLIDISCRDLNSLMSEKQALYPIERETITVGYDNFDDVTTTSYGGLKHYATKSGEWLTNSNTLRLKSQSLEGIAFNTHKINFQDGGIQFGYMISTPTGTVPSSEPQWAGAVFRAYDNKNMYVARVVRIHSTSTATIQLMDRRAGIDSVIVAVNITVNYDTWYYLRVVFQSQVAYVYTSTNGTTWTLATSASLSSTQLNTNPIFTSSGLDAVILDSGYVGLLGRGFQPTTAGAVNYIYFRDSLMWAGNDVVTIDEAYKSMASYAGLHNTSIDDVANEASFGTPANWSYNPAAFTLNSSGFVASDTVATVGAIERLQGTHADYETQNSFVAKFTVNQSAGAGAFMFFHNQGAGSYFQFEFASTSYVRFCYFSGGVNTIIQEAPPPVGLYSRPVDYKIMCREVQLSSVNTDRYLVMVAWGNNRFLLAAIYPLVSATTARDFGFALTVPPSGTLSAMTLTKFNISTLSMPLEYLTLSAGQPAMSAISDAVGERHIKSFTRFNGRLRVWRPRRKSSDWSIGPVYFDEVSSEDSRDGLMTSVRMWGVFHEAVYRDPILINRYGNIPREVNNPNMFTFEECLYEAKYIIYMALENSQRISISLPYYPILEPEDRITVLGNSYLVDSVEYRITGTALTSGINGRAYIYG